MFTHLLIHLYIVSRYFGGQYCVQDKEHYVYRILFRTFFLDTLKVAGRRALKGFATATLGCTTMTISFIWFCDIRFLPLGIVRTSCKARVSITLAHRPCNYVDSIGVGYGLSPRIPVLLLFNEQVDLPSCCYTYTSSCS